MHSRHRLTLLISIFMLLLTACGGSANDPAQAVESYLQAHQAKDAAQVASLSCAAWEEQARIELDSYAAVELTLDDIACQTVDNSDSTASVTCQGKIIASYGAEDLVIELAERPFSLVNEGGEWRVCGYQ